MTVSYYSSCYPDCPNAVDLLNDGSWFLFVTRPVADPELLETVRLAHLYGGYPWRDGDRYGILLKN